MDDKVCPGCVNENKAARDARKIAEGWRRTAIRHGYRDDVAAGSVGEHMSEADLGDDFYSAEKWREGPS